MFSDSTQHSSLSEVAATLTSSARPSSSSVAVRSDRMLSCCWRPRGLGGYALSILRGSGPENVHRHVLGTDHISHTKVDGLEQLLHRRYPHIDVASQPEDVLALLEKQPEFVTAGVDAIVVAVGDETIERRLNRLLPRDLLRVHVWLEPLGLGGHALVTGLSRPGCYECLYRHDEEYGLVNMASLAEPGQTFQRTIAGCGGTFTPFGAMDAERAAVEAAGATAESILGRTARPFLASWSSSASSFTESGHRLSRLGLAMQPGCLRRNEEFPVPTCAVCSQW